MAWLTIEFQSETLHMPVMLDVLIPQGRGGYRTLYLLHGAGGDHASWLLKTQLADFVEGKNLAVVMPSGDNRCYVDNIHGKDYFQYVAHELIEQCETWFPLSKDKQDRFIAGMSMGGYGAFYAAFQEYNQYAKVFSYSGLLDILQRYDHPQGLDLFPVFGSRQQLLDGNFDLFHQATDNQEYFQKSQEGVTRFYIFCGLQDVRIDMSSQMYAHLQTLGYDVSYETAEGGHKWDYWNQCIARTIAIISEKKEAK